MPNSHSITCKQLLDFILDYVEESLPPEQRAEFERHLQVCPSCVAYLDGYRRTIALGKAALQARIPVTEEPAHGFAPKSLIDAVLAARKSQV
jgi:anti-sigma factor RsiW